MSVSADSQTSRAATPVGLGSALASVRFDWISTFLAAWIVGGAYLDGWAHNHGRVDDVFITPWHGVLYSGVLAMSFFLGFTLVRNMARGYPWQRALPPGYLLSFAGALSFMAGGVFDFIWHTLFGIEVNVEALLSPSHLILLVSGVLMVSGPIRAAWARADFDRARGWAQLGPMILSSTWVLSLFTFFTQYAHPFTIFYRQGVLGQALSIAGILLQTVILMAWILLLVSRWRLPFGALAAIILANSALMSVFDDRFVLLPAALLAGLFADLLLMAFRPSTTEPVLYYLFAFSVPAAFYALYFLTLELTQGIGWRIHLWLGAILLAGLTGLLISILLVWASRGGPSPSHD